MKKLFIIFVMFHQNYLMASMPKKIEQVNLVDQEKEFQHKVHCCTVDLEKILRYLQKPENENKDIFLKERLKALFFKHDKFAIDAAWCHFSSNYKDQLASSGIVASLFSNSSYSVKKN